ncbi:hypothetical protein [Microcoleus sp. Pol10D4]
MNSNLTALATESRSHLRVIGLSAIASNNPQNFNYYRIVDRSDRDRLK